MSKLQQEERPNKIKGMAWLLQEHKQKQAQTNKERQREIEQHLRSQDKKWKKITNNRFEGYGKKIEQLVESSVKRESESFNGFHYQSMRQTESNLRQAFSDFSNTNFKAKRREYEGEIFHLKRKEKDIQNQIVKMDKLKEITGICEQKRSFYDGCVDRYFEDYRKDINKTISSIADRHKGGNR